jgi:D-glycero-alpha-D-manno-heptose-7-phosphate kinase
VIISRTPFRVSFFGGGTDYSPWFREHGGAVLSTTINRYCYLSCRHLPPFFNYRNRIVWSQIETVNAHDEIVHPVVREVLKMMQVQGVEIHHSGDLPSRAGLGSSSSFTVGILNALNRMMGKISTKQQLARTAIHIEQELLRENVGIQDQIAAAYGGFNKIEIGYDGTFRVIPITVPASRIASLQASLLMFYTGTSRIASDIAGEKIKAIPYKTAELHLMRRMVDEAIDILNSDDDINDFGRLLNEAWQIKRQLSARISPAFVDEIYATATAAGALGGKLLGAGGGGFMLFFVPPEQHADVLAALDHLLVVPIQFENSGSEIIFYDPDHYSRSSLTGKSFSKHLDITG